MRYRTLYRVVLLAIAACGGGEERVDATAGEASVSPACMEATTYQNLAAIEDKIFKGACAFAGCHNGEATTAGRLDLRNGMAHQTLIRASRIDPTRMLVVANEPTRSYLLMMLQQITPGMMTPPASPPPIDIGFMPQGAANVPLCSEMREAVERWIVQGALNN